MPTSSSTTSRDRSMLTAPSGILFRTTTEPSDNEQRSGDASYRLYRPTAGASPGESTSRSAPTGMAAATQAHSTGSRSTRTVNAVQRRKTVMTPTSLSLPGLTHRARPSCPHWLPSRTRPRPRLRSPRITGPKATSTRPSWAFRSSRCCPAYSSPLFCSNRGSSQS